VQAVDDVPVTDITSWLHDRALMSTVIHQHLLRAKQRMKKYADEQRYERQFNVDDRVFLKIQPYIQSSLAARSNQKPAFKFFGPYRVVARVGSVAYRLALPPSSSVHPVFHVSQLKKAVGARHTVTSTLPPSSVLWSVPAHILQQRQITKGKRFV
jgi:ribosomal protein L21E